MRCAVTVTLLPEARGGPFVYSDGLAPACAAASALGFDAVEIFPPSPAFDVAPFQAVLAQHRLAVSALGTGGGWLLHKLSLTHADAKIRADARAFIRGMIDRAAALGAPAIIGSMQGRWEGSVTRDQALAYLAEALEELGEHAANRGQVVLYEALNRYETNLLNRLGDTAAWLGTLRTRNIRILADLYHMNIEEADFSAALRAAGPLLGHVHFADSNRRAIGFGHIAVAPIVQTLRELGYAGYLSAEVFPLPDAATAATQTITAFRQFTRA